MGHPAVSFSGNKVRIHGVTKTGHTKKRTYKKNGHTKNRTYKKWTYKKTDIQKRDIQKIGHKIVFFSKLIVYKKKIKKTAPKNKKKSFLKKN